MIFTKSLYYPHIEIPDEGWLKTAVLYWDKIQTIVPESIDSPYETDLTKKLSEDEILIPLRVSSHMPEIRNLEGDVSEFLSSQEGAELITGASSRGGAYIHPEKLPSNIRRLMLHPEKMSHEIRHMIEDMDLSMEGRGGFLSVAPEFANFYMTLLANRLSESVGAGLVTGTSAAHNLGIKARADANLSSLMHRSDRHRLEYGLRRERYDVPKELVQGALYNLLIEKINIAPDTPIEKILEFREKYNSELCRFRSQVGSLTSGFPDEMPLQALQQHISDIYTNEIDPAINDLKSSLTGNKIKWFTESWMKIAFLSAASTSMLAQTGMGTTQALFAGAGLSLVGTACLYNNDKAQIIRSNPYQYLMEIQRGMP
jgi:hypothetical protein